ncbi:hypothetical protein ACSHWB_09435 [Lentzea sp. HUAS TT2]|uniref:hypothetical protein n=1 Tax=Lentzea sp. HUAS TT2 TaxID=3447454 RepID=UPI003F6F120C
MRGLTRTAVALTAFGTLFALTPAAGAQEDVTPKFSLTDRRVGNRFYAMIEEGTCPGGPVSLTSPAIATFDLASKSGTFVNTAGSYTATLKCKDTTAEGTYSFELAERITQPSPFLDKTEYAPGEAIDILLENGLMACKGLAGAAESPGFTAPAKLHPPAHGHSRLAGETTAIDTPGTYQASIQCPDYIFVTTFAIKAGPVTTTPPTTKPPVRKPPIIKPKGAADTGGGGTA